MQSRKKWQKNTAEKSFCGHNNYSLILENYSLTVVYSSAPNNEPNTFSYNSSSDTYSPVISNSESSSDVLKSSTIRVDEILPERSTETSESEPSVE